MKLVTIGGSGFLGLHVAQAMSRAGHEQIVLTRQPASARAFRLVPGVDVRGADVFDTPALVQHLEGADAVLSMAGILNESGHDGSGFERVHVQLVNGLIEASRKAGVERMLHVSALGAGAGKSHYQQTKGRAEEQLRASGLATTIFRPSVVFGRGDSFFTRFAALLRLAPMLPLACPNSRLQPVWAQDVGSAMVASLEREDAVGAAWELGGPEVYTLKELVQWTAKTLELKRPVIGLPDSVSRLQARVMDFVPGKPFSTDNFRSLQLDNITHDNALPALGIQPASIETIVPEYLVESSRQRRLRRARAEHEA